jgi:hypothetical protein
MTEKESNDHIAVLEDRLAKAMLVLGSLAWTIEHGEISKQEIVDRLDRIPTYLETGRW